MAIDPMYEKREKEKQDIRLEILEDVLEPRKVQSKYKVAVCNTEIILGKNSKTPISLETSIDNQLRNFAYSEGYLPSHRMLKFFELKKVRKLLKEYDQRPITADVQSICWNYNNKKLTKLEACKLIVAFYPKRASQEIKDYVAKRSA